ILAAGASQQMLCACQVLFEIYPLLWRKVTCSTFAEPKPPLSTLDLQRYCRGTADRGPQRYWQPELHNRCFARAKFCLKSIPCCGEKRHAVPSLSQNRRSLILDLQRY